MLVAIERVSGERGEGCPWHMTRDPFVQAVMGAHRHWCKGELASHRPGPVPHVLMRGLEVFDQALQAVQSFDIRNPASGPAAQEMPVGRGVRIRREPVHAGRRRR